MPKEKINLVRFVFFDVSMELMRDSIHWQIADQHVEGDSYNDLHDYVMAKAIEYMYLSQERFPLQK